MTNTAIETGTQVESFARGWRIAQQADRGEPIPKMHIVTFEDPAALARLLTAGRIDLLQAIKAKPSSITGIAARLHRDRSVVKRNALPCDCSARRSLQFRPTRGRRAEALRHRLTA